jgi:hypothetical protein
MAMPVNGLEVPLLKVTGCGELELPTPTLPKLTAPGKSETFAVPVPVRLAVWVPALSSTVSVPVRVPVCVGVKVTLMVQLEFAASEVPQLSFSAKSPEALMLIPVIALD